MSFFRNIPQFKMGVVVKARADYFWKTECSISLFYLTLNCQKLTEELVSWLPSRGCSSVVNQPAPSIPGFSRPTGRPAWCFSNKWPVCVLAGLSYH